MDGSSGVLSEFLDSGKDGVFIIGHASALARVGGCLVSFDPVWGEHLPYGDHWRFWPLQQSCDGRISEIELTFVSHIHADHVDPQVLGRVRGPVMTMAGRLPLTQRLREFCHVNHYPPHKWMRWNNRIEFYFVPHAFNSIDSSVFVRCRRTGFTVYHGNDNFLDHDTLVRLRSTIGRVDIAMVPYAFVHWYPFLMEGITEVERRKEAWRLREQSLDQARMFKDIMKPKVSIPFGSSLLYDCGVNHILNQSLARPHDLEGWLPLLAGGYVLEDGTHTEPMSRADLEEGLAAALGYRQEEPIEEFDADELDLDVIRQRVRGAGIRVPDHYIIVNNVVVDTEHLRVSISRRRVDKSCTRFRVDKREFTQWLTGQITFEQVIGTRRFRCCREPNIYNLRVFEFMQNCL